MWTQSRKPYTIVLVTILAGCAINPKCEWRYAQPAYLDVMSREWSQRVPYFLKLPFEEQHRVFMYSTFCMHPNTHFFDDAFAKAVGLHPESFAKALAEPSDEEQKVRVLRVLLHSDRDLFSRLAKNDRAALVLAMGRWKSREMADMASWLISEYPER